MLSSLLLASASALAAQGPDIDERDAQGQMIPDVFGSSPGDAGWYGPLWETDEAGALLASVSLVSFRGEAEQWLQVTVLGLGLEYGWCEGPYATQSEPRSVPITLPSEANGVGFVQVYVLMQVTHRETGDLLALEQTRPAYVLDAGVVGERWYSEQAAEAAVVRDSRVAVAEGEVVEGLVGLGVSP